MWTYNENIEFKIHILAAVKKGLYSTNHTIGRQNILLLKAFPNMWSNSSLSALDFRFDFTIPKMDMIWMLDVFNFIRRLFICLQNHWRHCMLLALALAIRFVCALSQKKKIKFEIGNLIFESPNNVTGYVTLSDCD